MNIGASSEFRKENKERITADPYNLILDALDGTDYDRGELETISAGLKHIHDGFARLVLILLEKKVLDTNDVKRLVEYDWK